MRRFTLGSEYSLTIIHGTACSRELLYKIIRKEDLMDTLEVMRTTFAARDYTDRPLDDATLHRILDHADSRQVGDRQGWRHRA